MRDCLKARTDELDHNDDIDLAEALRYLTGLSDGTHTGDCRCGYPRGLSGEAIAEAARIVAICDAFDAMRASAPWRPDSMSIQAALNELKQGAGRQFDGQFVDTFIDLIRREFWERDDFDAFLAEGADQLEYIRARIRMEELIASGR